MMEASIAASSSASTADLPASMTDTEADGASTLKAQELGVHKMEERTLGGKGATDQDVSIFLIQNGGTKDHMLACIRLHSCVLSTHSNYFRTCLSQRWNRPASPSESLPIEFRVEAQSGVDSYLDCFSSMYSPLMSFEGVEHALEVLKVASQIEYQELMNRISLYLSCKQWSQEDEIRIRHYVASPDFPRIHLKDLVARLGMDAGKEQGASHIRELTQAVFKAVSEEGESYPVFLEGIGRCGYSDFSRMVVGVVSDEAKKMFIKFAHEWNGKSPAFDRFTETGYKLGAMKWVLESLLNENAGEEVVECIVHLDSIPKYAYAVHLHRKRLHAQYHVPDLAEVVLRMYKEVVAGTLLLKSPHRLALLLN